MTVVVFVQLDEAHDVKKAQEQLQKTVSDMQTTLQRIQAPNMRAMEKWVPSAWLATAFLSVGVCVPTVLYREFKAQQHTLWKSMQGYVPKRGGASRACAMGRPVPVFVLSLCLPVHRCVGPHVCKFDHFEGSPGLQYAHHR